MYRALADAVLIVHLAFVLFIVIGGLAVARWPRLAWAHVPAAVWGALIELLNWTCPLTPLENHLRLRAGGRVYEESFVEHYFMPFLYPEELTRPVQVMMGLFVVLVNGAIYAWILRRLISRARS